MTNTINDNWYEDFFQGINCKMLEIAYSPEWTKLEVDFLISELNIEQGQHILDIRCGFGRHAIELAKRGFNVTGIDISSTFIKSLSEITAAENLSIQAIEADILLMELEQKFSGGVCMGNSFGYFDYEKMKLFVAKVAYSLETGARFIINSGMIAESILSNFAQNKSFPLGNMTMDITNHYNANESYMTSHLMYTKEGKSEEHSFKHYVFTLGEVKRLLQLYGLAIIATYSSSAKIPYKMGDPQVYIVAEKE